MLVLAKFSHGCAVRAFSLAKLFYFESVGHLNRRILCPENLELVTVRGVPELSLGKVVC